MENKIIRKWTGLTVGDFNGDSFSDLVVGSPGFNQEDGKIDVYFGSPSALLANPKPSPVFHHHRKLDRNMV